MHVQRVQVVPKVLTVKTCMVGVGLRSQIELMPIEYQFRSYIVLFLLPLLWNCVSTMQRSKNLAISHVWFRQNVKLFCHIPTHGTTFNPIVVTYPITFLYNALVFLSTYQLCNDKNLVQKNNPLEVLNYLNNGLLIDGCLCIQMLWFRVTETISNAVQDRWYHMVPEAFGANLIAFLDNPKITPPFLLNLMNWWPHRKPSVLLWSLKRRYLVVASLSVFLIADLCYKCKFI